MNLAGWVRAALSVAVALLAASASAQPTTPGPPAPDSLETASADSSWGLPRAVPGLCGSAEVPAAPCAARRGASHADSVAAEGAADSSLVWWHIAVAGAGAGLLGGAAIERLHVGWWDERSPKFRFHDDHAYALNADKWGHAWGAMFLARTTALSLETAGLRPATATAFGAGSAWGLLLVHEVYDGYGPYWGFSLGDIAGNTAGVLWEIADRHVDAMGPFDFKLSFWPSGSDDRTLMEDYRGQTYWLTAVPHGLAPEAAKPYLPPWLGVGVGNTVRGFEEGTDFPNEREWYVGLDLNVCGLGLRGPLAKPLCETFRAVHLPMPALRIAPEVRAVPFAY